MALDAAGYNCKIGKGTPEVLIKSRKVVAWKAWSKMDCTWYLY